MHTFQNAIGGKIFNSKETVQSIDVEEWLSNTHHCNCEHSIFKDLHHQHIITGDLRIVKDRILHALLIKGPNCRENKRINCNKAMELTMIGLTE